MHSAPAIATALQQVRERVVAAAKRAGRDPSQITLVVVTKGVTPEKIREAAKAGVLIFGETVFRKHFPRSQP